MCLGVLQCFPLILPAGESGSADTVRDPRGFAVKFYTEDGNWDLVGNNTPIFFIRDAILVGDGLFCCLQVLWICIDFQFSFMIGI